MRTVLLIDDSRTARILLSRIFQEIGGWTIMEAENGQIALDKLSQQHAIDLACIDWNMPVMNGLDFLKSAKKLTACKNAWMMMVTTETELDNITMAMVAGANEYVMKPFTRDMIREKLELMGLAGC